MMKKQNYILIGALVILLAILSVILISGYIKQIQQKTQETVMEFSSGPCDPDISPCDSSELGIKQITWINETTLKVKAYVSINCAEEIESGNYEITNDKIILIYKSPRCKDVCANCLCAHELVYNFTNLKRKDYQFELKRVE